MTKGNIEWEDDDWTYLLTWNESSPVQIHSYPNYEELMYRDPLKVSITPRTYEIRTPGIEKYTIKRTYKPKHRGPV